MIQGFNPRTGEPAGEPVPETTPEQVTLVVQAAAAAGNGGHAGNGGADAGNGGADAALAPDGGWAWDGAWAPSGTRARALELIADALDARAGELAGLADTETALGMPRLTGEVARTTGQLRLFASVVRDGGYLDATVSPAAGGAPDVRRIERPLGPVAVFAASNFPFAFSVAGNDTASALAAGCPVVVKAHEAHPRTAVLTGEIVTQALARAGAPAGTFAVVHGVEAGLALLRHPGITAAGFTGSTPGGLFLAKVCANRDRPIPFFGELGSANPVVVLPGAAAARAAEIAVGYADSLTLGAGQFCTNPGLLFVPDDDTLLAKIAESVTASAGGPMLTGKIFSAYQQAVAETGKHPGVRRLADGAAGEGPWGATPRVFSTTLKQFADSSAVLGEERFGPAGLVITYGSVAELLPVIAALDGRLVGCVHAEPGEHEAARQVVAALQRVAGRIVFNGWPTGVAVVAAQQHGGPWPATTAPAYTSVGSAAIRRWLVPVAYQGFPADLLPVPLRPERSR
jgi:NADP-dependent aldehyde dehydrogenase